MAVSTSLTEPTLELIWHATLLCGVLTLGLVIAIVAVSSWHFSMTKRYKAMDDAWASWLLSHQFFEVPPPQAKSTKMKNYLLDKWIAMLIAMPPTARPLAGTATSRASIAAHALSTLRWPFMRSPHTLESAISIVGLLQLPGQESRLIRHLQHTELPVVFAAGLALLRLDNRRIDTLWAQLPITELSKSALLTLLEESDPQCVNKLIHAQLATAKPAEAASFLLLWSQIPENEAQDVGRKLLLTKETPVALLSAALRVLQSSEDLPLVRHYLQHADWPVRLNAVKAMGRLGHGQDLEALRCMEDHPNWWIRTRVREQLAHQHAEKWAW